MYPTKAQEQRLREWQGALRFLWNLANEQRLLGLARSKSERRYYTGFDQINQLTDLRKELPWLNDVPRNVCAQLLTELDKAWKRCFAKQAGQPRWKRKGRVDLGLCEPHPKVWRLAGDMIRFPKVGNLRAVIHRAPEGKPKTCTLRCEAGQWFASCLYELDVADPAPRTGPVVAIDRGITVLLARSDGHMTENPRCYDRAMKRLAKAQRIVCRRKKGSKNREKAKLRVAVLHQKVRRQRAHCLHVESSRLAKSHGVVVMEKLNVSGMKRGKLGRSISDAAWSMFENMVRYKLEWSGGKLVNVAPHFSSQTCAECGVVDPRSRNGVLFRCTACGHVDHADTNASKVLYSRVNRSALPAEGSRGCPTRRSRKRGFALESSAL